MKYREIIKSPTAIKLSELKEESDIDYSFLCTKYQKQGYCIANFYKYPSTNQLISISNFESKRQSIKSNDKTPITKRDILNMVKIKTDKKEKSFKSIKNSDYKKSLNIILLLIFILINYEGICQTVVPFKKKSGNYIYVDSATMEIKQTGLIRNLEFKKASFFNSFGVALVELTTGVWTQKVITKSGILLDEEIFDSELLFDSKGKDFLIYFSKRNDVRGNINFITSKHETKFFEFGKIKCFNESKLAVLQSLGSENKWGFYHLDGRNILPPSYIDVHPFNEGMAAVQSPLGWGFIDSSGKEIIKAKFKSVRDFNNGLANVIDNDGKRYFINKNGVKIISVAFDFEKDFIDDKILFSTRDNYRKLLYKNGKLENVIFPIHTSGDEFYYDVELYFGQYLYFNSKCLIYPYKCECQEKCDALYDTKGNKIIPFKFQKIGPPTLDGKIRYLIRNKGWGYLDIKGFEVIPATYYTASDYFRGFAIVSSIKGYFLIDTLGNVVIDFNNIYKKTEGSLKDVLFPILSEDDLFSIIKRDELFSILETNGFQKITILNNGFLAVPNSGAFYEYDYSYNMKYFRGIYFDSKGRGYYEK